MINKKKFFSYKIMPLWGMIFFIVNGCSQAKEDPAITIHWEDEKATGMTIPYKLFGDIPIDEIAPSLNLQLENTGTPILGDKIPGDEEIFFRPVIPFTRGLKYDVLSNGKIIKQIVIPLPGAKAPMVVNIYPSGYTLPVNLLKVYIEFSKPMQDGNVMEHISVIKNDKDTVPVFLELEPALWNKERTTLTLWLDPGRIKRELQPNQTLGAPLELNTRYQVLVKPGWKDVDGLPVAHLFRKDFITGPRDGNSPNPAEWDFYFPGAGTINPVTMELHEPLDYQLLKNAVRVTDAKGDPVDGKMESSGNETTLHFYPSKPWVAGTFIVEVEPVLEDLAGNNLYRLFDKDLFGDTNKEEAVYKRSFLVK